MSVGCDDGGIFWRGRRTLLRLVVAVALIGSSTLTHSEPHEDIQALFAQAEEANDRGDYAKAADLYMSMLSLVEEEYGPNHLAVAGGLSLLGAAYGKQGDYAKAEAVFKRALAVIENLRGPNHPDVAVMLDGLAQAYLAQGR